MVLKTINKIYYEGISESERQRRKESNSLSTKINFWAWIIEVITYYPKRVEEKIVLQRNISD